MSDSYFDVNKVKSFGTINEMLAQGEKEWEARHPFYNWFDNVFYNSKIKLPFRGAPHRIFSDFLGVILDWKNELGWAYQRLFRGWDDRASWSVDLWLNGMMPDILKQLKKNKYGTPIMFYEGLKYDVNYGYGEEADKIACEKWNSELDKMILAFETSRNIDTCLYSLEEEKELQQTIDEGMQSFIKYYRCLWD